MKGIKSIKTITTPFFFKDLSHEQVASLFNNEYPVDIRHNEDLVNRIFAKYPLIDKSHISIIVKATFQSIRELLILGKILNFNGLLFDMKLFFFAHCRNMVIFPSLKVEVTTPPPLRKI